MSERQAWANAFAQQARSDWSLYLRLVERGEAVCHALHFLQMACEKIAKAYRIRDLSSDVAELTQHHVGFKRFVRAFLLSPAMRVEFEGRAQQLQAVLAAVSSLAGEIERLAPAVDRVARPDNAEYPWFDGAVVVVPCEYGFPNLSLLGAPQGRTLLNVIRRSMDEFERIHIV